MNLARLGLTAGALLALAACDQASPQGAKAPDASASVAPPPVAAAPTVSSRPVPPPWAISLLSKPLVEVFPEPGRCSGAVEGLSKTYVDARAIVGWGWDEAAGKPVGRLVAVNRKGLMVGFGEGGEPRPNLASHGNAGWTLVTIAPAMNGVRIYAIDQGRKTACQIGEVAQVPL